MNPFGSIIFSYWSGIRGRGSTIRHYVIYSFLLGTMEIVSKGWSAFEGTRDRETYMRLK